MSYTNFRAFLFQNYVKSRLWIFTCETLVKESVEDALEEAQEQIEEGADDVRKALDEAGDEIEKAKEKLE